MSDNVWLYGNPTVSTPHKKRTVITRPGPSNRIPVAFTHISPTDDPLIFQGQNGLECEEFVFAVRQRAFAKDKLDDARWTATLAASCFFGEALRWHVALDNSTKNDWELLQKALFAKYPPVPSVPWKAVDLDVDDVPDGTLHRYVSPFPDKVLFHTI